MDLESGDVRRFQDVPGATTSGCDGIAVDGEAIITVQNGARPAQVVRFDVDTLAMRIARAVVLDRQEGSSPEPTIGTLADDPFVYAANIQWEAFDEKRVRRSVVALTRPRLVAVEWDLTGDSMPVRRRPRTRSLAPRRAQRPSRSFGDGVRERPIP